MNQSVSEMLKENKNNKKKHIKWIIPVGIIILGVGTYLRLEKEVETSYIPEIYEVKKGDISSAVSSDGNIINPDIANLSFLINGNLKELYVKEGDQIEAGQTLAELDKQDLNFDLKSAENDVNISWQNIKATETDITDLDIINAQNDFEVTQEQSNNTKLSAEQNYEITKQKSESTKKTTEQNLEQAFTDAKLTLEASLSSTKEALTQVDFTLGIEKYYTGETISEAFNDSARESTIKNLYRDTYQEFTNLKSEYDSKKYYMEQADVSRMVFKTKELTQNVLNILENTEKLVNTAQEGRGITQSTISSQLRSIQSFRSQIESTNNQISQAKQNIDTSFLNLQNTFTTINNDIDCLLYTSPSPRD